MGKINEEPRLCPVTKKIMIWDDCQFGMLKAERMVPDSDAPDGFLENPDWEKICMACPHHCD